MRHLILLIALFVMACISSCLYHQHDNTTNLRIFDGYIIKDSETDNTFYLQDMESARLIELKFINDDHSELSFSDFGHVEVIGQYNKNYNFLVVDQILDTRELIVLDPLGHN